MTLRRMNVAMVGHGFMGAAHSQAWRVAPRFFDLPVEPRMKVVVGRSAESTAAGRHAASDGKRAPPTGAMWWRVTTSI